MKKFVARMKADKKFAKGFQDALIKDNKKVAALTKQFGNSIDKVVADTIAAYAKKNKMTLKKDKEIEKSYAAMCKQIGLQLNDMIVKQIRAVCKIQGETKVEKTKKKACKR